MKLHNKEPLIEFQTTHPDSSAQIKALLAEIEDKETKWQNPHQLKAKYPRVSILKNRQAIFDICHNKYRLWVSVDYAHSIVMVRKIGTHKEYDKWQIN